MIFVSYRITTNLQKQQVSSKYTKRRQVLSLMMYTCWSVSCWQKEIHNFILNWNTFNKQGLEVPIRVNDIPKLGRFNILNKSLFELDKILSQVYINSIYSEPQVDILLYETYYYLISKLQCLINKDSHMKYMS